MTNFDLEENLPRKFSHAWSREIKTIESILLFELNNNSIFFLLELEILSSKYTISWMCLSQEEKRMSRLTNRRKNIPRTVNAIKLVATDNKNNCLLDLIFENVDLTKLKENKFIFSGLKQLPTLKK